MKLLIVDDEEEILNMLRRNLEREGYEFATTTKPLENGTPIDVIVSIKRDDPHAAPKQVVIKGEVVHSKIEGEDEAKGPGMGV